MRVEPAASGVSNDLGRAVRRGPAYAYCPLRDRLRRLLGVVRATEHLVIGEEARLGIDHTESHRDPEANAGKFGIPQSLEEVAQEREACLAVGIGHQENVFIAAEAIRMRAGEGPTLDELHER